MGNLGNAILEPQKKDFWEAPLGAIEITLQVCLIPPLLTKSFLQD